MKKIIPFLLFALVIFSCRKKEIPQQPKNNPDFAKAEAFVFKENDSAYYYFSKVATATGIADSLEIATSYYYMACIQDDEGDYFGSQESVTLSLKFLDERNPKHFSYISSNYNELGITSFNLKKYQLALQYYDLGLKFCDDETVRSMILNNKAMVYQRIGDYMKAIKIYETIMPKYKEHPKEFARALSNLTRTKWLQNTNYNAGPSLLRALAIREKGNDEWGLNASYAHLTDYYTKKQPDSAVFYATKMYRISQKLRSPDDQLEALQKLIVLSPPLVTKKIFQTYQNLADSLQTTRNAAKNQFAVIRYETEKNKAENLALQQENTKKKYQILTRELLLGFGALFIIVASIIAAIWYRKRKQRIELETQNTVRESQLRTSKRVHDVVANGLYRVMTEIENQEAVDKELILDKIEDLYEKSRDISYEKPIIKGQNFHEELSELLISFATSDTKILIAGNTRELWQKVNPVVKYEVEHILQELMVNMRKHSQARHVALKFDSTESDIHVNYKDDGIGMPEDHQFKNGLRNTGNRIDFIKGAITFDTNLEKGLNVRISFPHA